MTTASAYLTVRGIDVDVVYKDIKNLHIGVYPPMGRVRVSAPHRLDDDQVEQCLKSVDGLGMGRTFPGDR
jgi:predicted metal-dependent hydrolase